MRFEGEEYRFGFGGQERDNEIYGSGNSYTAEYWQYDSRLGRRWNVDPVTYPWQSPYSAFNNNPLVFNDPRGLEGNPTNDQSNTKPDPDGKSDYTFSDVNVYGDKLNSKPQTIFSKITNRITKFYSSFISGLKKDHYTHTLVSENAEKTNNAGVEGDVTHYSDATLLEALAGSRSFGLYRKNIIAWYYYMTGFFTKTTHALVETAEQTQEVITKIQTQKDIENAVKQRQEQIMNEPKQPEEAFNVPEDDSTEVKWRPEGEETWYDVKVAPDGGGRVIGKSEN